MVTGVQTCALPISVENDSQTEFWHKRFSYISEKGLKLLAKNNNLARLKRTQLEKCSDCLAGKQNRVSFTSSSSRKPDILDLVYSDVYGMKVKTLDGSIYFVTFIDDHSRKI